MYDSVIGDGMNFSAMGIGFGFVLLGVSRCYLGGLRRRRSSMILCAIVISNTCSNCKYNVILQCVGNGKSEQHIVTMRIRIVNNDNTLE
jgi:hypothetical protein